MVKIAHATWLIWTDQALTAIEVHEVILVCYMINHWNLKKKNLIIFFYYICIWVDEEMHSKNNNVYYMVIRQIFSKSMFKIYLKQILNKLKIHPFSTNFAFNQLLYSYSFIEVVYDRLLYSSYLS